MTALAAGPWSMPDAEIVLPTDAPRHLWLAERRKGIGGSDASTIAGVNEYSGGLYELYLDKTGRLPERTATARMEAGTRLEPVMRQWFQDQTGIAVRRQGLTRSKANPFMQVSLDGLTIDGGVFESKATNWRLADEWDDDQVPDHAEIQVQHGMAVTGRPHAWVVVLVDGWDFQIRRVERDEKLIDLLTSMERAFWTDHVLADVEPLITAQALKVVKGRYGLVELATVPGDPVQVEPLIEQWQAGKAAIKAAEQVKDAAEANLRNLLGPAEAMALLGETRLTCKANGTFASTRFVTEHPDLAEQLTTRKPVLDVDRLKAEHPDIYETYRARVLREVKPKKAGK